MRVKNEEQSFVTMQGSPLWSPSSAQIQKIYSIYAVDSELINWRFFRGYSRFNYQIIGLVMEENAMF